MHSSARPPGGSEPDPTDDQDHGLQHDLQLLARQSRDRRRMLGVLTGAVNAPAMPGHADDGTGAPADSTGVGPAD